MPNDIYVTLAVSSLKLEQERCQNDASRKTRWGTLHLVKEAILSSNVCRWVSFTLTMTTNMLAVRVGRILWRSLRISHIPYVLLGQFLPVRVGDVCWHGEISLYSWLLITESLINHEKTEPNNLTQYKVSWKKTVRVQRSHIVGNCRPPSTVQSSPFQQSTSKQESQPRNTLWISYQVSELNKRPHAPEGKMVQTSLISVRGLSRAQAVQPQNCKLVNDWSCDSQECY